MTKHLFNNYYLDVLKQRRAQYKTAKTYVWQLECSQRLLKYFEGYYLEDMCIKTVQEFFDTIRFKPNGELYSERYLKALKSFMNYTFIKAVKDELLVVNPFNQDFIMPYTKRTSSIDRFIMDKDLKLLFGALKENSRFAILIPFLLVTGIRIGEMCALQWNDLDIENNMIYIRNGTTPKYVFDNDHLKPKQCGVMLTDPKTESSIRKIPVNPIAFKCIDMWKVHIKSRTTLEDRIRANRSEKMIFVNYYGRVMNAKTLSKKLREFLDKHGLFGVTFHKLRHTFATQLVDADVELNIIKELLGHNSIMTTSKFYAKVNDQPKINAIQKHYAHIKSMYQNV